MMPKILAIANIYTGTGKGFKDQFAQYKKPHQVPDFGPVLVAVVKAVN